MALIKRRRILRDAVSAQPSLWDQIESFNTFTRFPDLPLELRLTVWDLATPSERVVEVRMHVLRNDESNKEAEGVRFTSPTPTPAILHVNREARTAAMKYYQKSFTSYLRPLDQPGSIIYVNLDNETIFLTCKEQEDLIFGLVKMNMEERDRVMNVAVEQKFTHFKSLMTAYALAMFPALKRGIMVMQDNEDGTRKAGPESKTDYSNGIVLRDLFGPDRMSPYFLEYEFHRVLCTHVEGRPDMALYDVKPKFFKRKLMLESLRNI